MPKLNQNNVIRTVADLAALSDADLANCLSGLRAAIQERKSVHAKALASGALPPDAPLGFHEYTWSPHPERESKWDQPFGPTTPIEQLPIRRRAMHQLKEMRVLALEDVSTLSESELLRCKDMGATTVTRLRELLHAIELDFATPSDPASAEYHRNRMLRRLGPEELLAARRGLPDDAPITRLGLHPGTIERALRAGLKTLGDLRGASLRTLDLKFGRSGVREVYLALEDTGTGLRSKPTQMELWRSGVLELEQLRKPEADDVRVTELRPWIGASVEHLDHAGVTTLGQLRAAVSEGHLEDVRFLGETGRRRVQEFLGLVKPQVAPQAAAPSAVANSVFALAAKSG